MKITLERDTLLQALQLVSGAVEKRQTLPILSHILFQCNDNHLSLTATDLEVELMARISLSEKVEPYAFTVPARKLIDICRALPDGATVKFEHSDNRLLIRSGASRFVLSTLNPEEFPKVGKSEQTAELSLPQSVLKFLLEKTHFTMAQQDVRYYLNGMLFDLANDHIRIVATDGHRLALATYKEAFKFKKPLQVIVPRKAVLELMRLLEDSDTPIRVVIGSNHIHAAAENFVFTAKLIDGKFPDFNRVIPKNVDKIATINRGLLKEALSRAAILCNEKYHGIRVIFDNGNACIQANNTEQEEAEEKLPINYGHEKLDIGFNVNYLLDALNSLPEGDIKVSMWDANSSVLIEHAEVQECLYVVMPMRL